MRRLVALAGLPFTIVDHSGLPGGHAGDFDIVFNYDKIQWETGDASDGYDGAGRPIPFTLGSGPTSQTCTAITGSDEVARCPLPVDQPLGPIPLAATFGGDGYNQPADASASTIAFAYLATGAFVVGDGNAVVGASVTLWSPQGCAQNGVDPCPAAFNGYADSAGITPYQDGGTWTASPGASSDPPNTVPTYVAVLTTDAVTKSGPRSAARSATRSSSKSTSPAAPLAPQRQVRSSHC